MRHVARNAGKPPIPQYRYKLVTVANSREAELVETALRDLLRSCGLSFFAICRVGGTCDVMGDAGATPLPDSAVANARAVAAKALRSLEKPKMGLAARA